MINQDICVFKFYIHLRNRKTQDECHPDLERCFISGTLRTLRSTEQCPDNKKKVSTNCRIWHIAENDFIELTGKKKTQKTKRFTGDSMLHRSLRLIKCQDLSKRFFKFIAVQRRIYLVEWIEV